MSVYSKYILPWGINLACGGKPIARQRAKIVPRARGEVLEIGIGSGLNLPFYDGAKVQKVWGLEPCPEMRRMAERVAGRVDFPVEFLDLPGEDIPLDDQSVDTVLVTYTLCTIPQAALALQQIHRVLKPGAELLFCEHGRAPDENVRRWQDRIDPLWSKFSGGCHLNRPIDRLLQDAGFRITEMETMYIPGPRTHTFNYWGAALAE
ncbi:MAG: class I SAM-dependent methyltransferase [Proteobacteria bacterium]|nr:class I SAM-dependent methyltransferase [Pseudomonadota bacterium]